MSQNQTNNKTNNDTNENMNDTDEIENQNQNNFKKIKPMHKIGRTLLVKSFNNSELEESFFKDLEGLDKIATTKISNSVFLTFNNPENALTALRTLKNKSQTIRIKFSYYKIFFTISGLQDSTDYNEVKKDLIDFISNKMAANVLYCKFYCKDKKYLGCGDLTVDTLDTMIQLLSKESGLKDFSFKSYTGSFYKFNDKKKNL